MTSEKDVKKIGFVWEIKSNITFKRLILLVVLFFLVLMPTTSNASTNYLVNDLENDDQSISNDSKHGYLSIQTKNITVPIRSRVSELQVIKMAKAEATHIWPAAEINEPVKAIYSISRSDIRKINRARQTSDKVTITVKGLYKYFCTFSHKDYFDVVGEAKVNVSFRHSSYKVTFNGNGGKVQGKERTTVSLDCHNYKGACLGTSKMPKKMTKEGCAFKGWSSSKNTYEKFTAATLVTENTDLYAFWTEEEALPAEKSQETPVGETKQDKKTETKNSLKEIPVDDIPITDGKGDGNEQSKPMSKDAFISLAQDQHVPVASLGRGSVPLYAPVGSQGWALINFVVTVIGALLVLMCAFFAFKQKRDKKSLWFVMPIIAAIANFIVFYLTQDMNLNMVLADGWTTVNVILFVIATAGVIKFLSKKSELVEYIYNY